MFSGRLSGKSWESDGKGDPLASQNSAIALASCWIDLASARRSGFPSFFFDKPLRPLIPLMPLSAIEICSIPRALHRRKEGRSGMR